MGTRYENEGQFVSPWFATWQVTSALRWYRPAHGADTDRVLQQRWVSDNGQQEWRDIQVAMED